MLMSDRTCTAITEKGEPCRQAPLEGELYCFWHSPGCAEQATEARRLGGLRRRKEKITQGAYDFEGLESVAQIRRLLEVAVVDTLGLESSIARSRALAYLAQMALKRWRWVSWRRGWRRWSTSCSPARGRKGGEGSGAA